MNAKPGAKSVVSGSAQHKARVAVARKILAEAQLGDSHVIPAMHHSESGARASAVQMVSHDDPPTVRYAAAWYGLLAQEPAVNVFFPHPNGGNNLHVLTTGLPESRIVSGLKAAGVPKFTVHKNRVYIYDPDPGTAAAVEQFARESNARHSVVPGYGFPIGGGARAAADAGSRADYRQVIHDFESAGAPAAAKG